MTKPTEIYYIWQEWATVDGESEPRLLTPWADPDEYEFPFDFLFDSPEAAIIGKKEWEAEEEDWILCKMTIEPMGEKTLVDQFDRPIPDDLVLMPNPKHLFPSDIKLVDNADWYDADGYLLASARAISFLSEDSLEDATGIRLDSIKEILLVSPALHRWSDEDGFYHA